MARSHLMRRARVLFWIALMTAGCSNQPAGDPPGTAAATARQTGDVGPEQGATGRESNQGDAAQARGTPPSATSDASVPGSTLDAGRADASQAPRSTPAATDAAGASGSAAAGAVAADAGSPSDAGPAASAVPTVKLPPATTARLDTLVTPAQLGISERGAFTAGGRFFVDGGEGIYEIVGGPPGTYSAVLIAPNPGCSHGGLIARGERLYAPCTNPDSLTVELVVYEPARKQPLVSRAPILTTSSAHFNGVAFGPDGALYLSNSLANDSPDPAVVRLEILDEEPLEFTQTPFVAASPANGPANVGGGLFPNGIRFHGDTMYLARGPDIVAVPVGLGRPDAPLKVAYTPSDSSSVIDDFDIADERMWLSEFSPLRVLGLPGESRLVVTDLKGNLQFAMDLPFIPSATVYAVDTMFGPFSIIITSFYDGGLYRVTLD